MTLYKKNLVILGGEKKNPNEIGRRDYLVDMRIFNLGFFSYYFIWREFELAINSSLTVLLNECKTKPYMLLGGQVSDGLRGDRPTTETPEWCVVLRFM
jgi:hypothetical protein